jgi:sulfate/thiosulfate transport system permease protein
MAAEATAPAAPGEKAAAPKMRRIDTKLAATGEPRWFQWILISAAVLYLFLLLFVPLLTVFAGAFEKGLAAYFDAFADPDTLFSIKLTLIIAALAVPLNLTFGVAASWAIAKFDFRGKNVLTSFIDLPFAVSPVVSGLIYVLLFGKQGWLGPSHDLKIIFAVPGILMATVFITFPMVARELIPLMEEQGKEEEEAALTLGASGWQTFWHVTLPNIKWGVLYGVILTNARAMGRIRGFGAYPGHDHHPALAGGNPLQRVQLRAGVLGRLPALLPGPDHAGRQGRGGKAGGDGQGQAGKGRHASGVTARRKRDRSAQSRLKPIARLPNSLMYSS